MVYPKRMVGRQTLPVEVSETPGSLLSLIKQSGKTSATVTAANSGLAVSSVGCWLTPPTGSITRTLLASTLILIGCAAHQHPTLWMIGLNTPTAAAACYSVLRSRICSWQIAYARALQRRSGAFSALELPLTRFLNGQAAALTPTPTPIHSDSHLS